MLGAGHVTQPFYSISDIIDAIGKLGIDLTVQWTNQHLMYFNK